MGQVIHSASMPFKSKAQNSFAHTQRGLKAFGGRAKVEEWEAATDYKDLPKKVSKPKRGLKFVRIGGK